MTKQEEDKESPRPYRKNEIQQVLQEAEEREELAILTMSTSAVRIGALPRMQSRDLTFIEEYDLYAILVYPRTLSQYWTFLTPQASEKIANIVDKLKPTDYIFANKLEPDLPAKSSALSTAIWRLLVKVGLCVPSNDPLKRQEVQIDHGFRKFARTTWDNSGIREEYAERLEGHGKKLVRTYAMPTPLEWIRTCEFPKAIPQLTF